MIIIDLHTFMSINDKVKICNSLAIAAYLGISLEVAVSIVTVVIEPPLIGVYDSILIRATVEVSCYTKVLLQCTRDRVSEYRACLFPAGLCPRRVSNPVLQANLLYLYFSIPLSPLSPFLCVFAGKPLSRALIERRTERLYKARASVLSRGSLGYRDTSGPAAPCVHTETRSVKITHNLRKTNG